MGELSDADALLPPDEIVLDPLSQAEVNAVNDRETLRKLEVMQGFAVNQPTGKARRVIFRFLVSPVELFGDDEGRVTSMKIVKNELYQTDNGALRPRATEQMETIPVGLVFRSIGYLGVPLPGVPFHERWGVILNESGRVVAPDSGEPVVGEYTAGWIKRGPSGVIGTNKPDAVETVNLMLEDMAAGRTLQPTHTDPDAIAALVTARQPDRFTYEDWLRLDELEAARGAAQGRPRVKFATVAEMIAAIKEQ
jgi:ferredoxin--NADP+ reductase